MSAFGYRAIVLYKQHIVHSEVSFFITLNNTGFEPDWTAPCPISGVHLITLSYQLRIVNAESMFWVPLSGITMPRISCRYFLLLNYIYGAIDLQMGLFEYRMKIFTYLQHTHSNCTKTFGTGQPC